MRSTLVLILFLVGFIQVFWSQKSQLLGFKPQLNPTSEPYLEYVKEHTTKESVYFYDSLNWFDKEKVKRLLEERLKSKQKLLESNNIITDGPIYTFLDGILQKLKSANPDIPQDAKIVLYRDDSFNASTFGDGLIFVNLGLLYKLKNEDQVALVLGHELGHNTARHTLENLQAQLLAEKDVALRKEIKLAILKPYGNITALNDLLRPRVYALKEKSRMDEFEADSLGFLYFSRAGYSAEKALSMFYAMEHSREERNKSSLDVLKLFKIDSLSDLGLKYKQYTRETSLGMGLDTPDDNPYLLSHPYEKDRLNKLLVLAGLNKFDSIVKEIDPSYRFISYQTDGEMLTSSLMNDDFSRAFFYALNMANDYENDMYSREHLAYILSSLALYKKTRQAGKYLRLQKLWYDESFDRIVYFLQCLSPINALDLGRTVWSDWCKEDEAEQAYNAARLGFYYLEDQLERCSISLETYKELNSHVIYKKFYEAVQSDFIISGKAKKVNYKK